MVNPRVTVVIPSHNYGQWLDGCLSSVATQDYPVKRVVVVDDGSQDGTTPSLLKKLSFSKKILGADKDGFEGAWAGIYQEGLSVLLARFQRAGGPSRARNWAIQAAWNDTDLFSFLDADDQFLPERLNKTVRPFVIHPEQVGAVYSDYDTYNLQNNNLIRVYKEPFSRGRLLSECIVHSACVVSKGAFKFAGLYDENLRVAEDWDLWCRISRKFMFVHIPEPLMLVRVGNHNSTATVPQSVWQECYRRVVERNRG